MTLVSLNFLSLSRCLKFTVENRDEELRFFLMKLCLLIKKKTILCF
jgi:hypothetical protein